MFDLSLSEWEDSLSLLLEAKDHFHEEAAPGGYNVGWNEGAVAGQETDHVRMFVIPRWADEPLAGRGIRYRLKQPANQRRSGLLDDLSGKTLLSGELCSFRRAGERTQVGSGVIITHDPNRETVFDLTPDEWRETFCLLRRVKRLLDEKHRPDGYTLGWNCGRIAGQEIRHVHMHVIPRHADEPLHPANGLYDGSTETGVS